MYLKRWMVALLAVLALVACGSPAVQAVARYDNVILSRQDLDQRIDRIETALKKQEGAQVPSRLDIEKELVTGANGFISQNLLLAVAKQRGVTVTDKEIDNTIGQFRTSVAQGANGQSFDEVVQGALGLPGGNSSEFRQFASFFVARQKLAETLVTTDTVRQQVTDQVMAEAGKQVMTANVAHILVATEAEANAVIDRLNKGEKFEDLAKELSTDPGSKDNGGLYENVQQGQMVAEFDKATFEDLKPGETTKTPVKTQFGYHIIRLISRAEGPAMTPEQAQQAIEQGIGQQLQQSRGTALEKLLADERDKAKKDGRLIEPTYPEPTAAPAQPTEPAAPAVPTPAS